jgi:hypothetical protein
MKMLYDPKWKIPLTASEVLLKAADILERDGWCKYSLHDGQGRHCVAGAILLAVAGSPGGDALRNEARQLLGQHLSFWPTIESWNDLPWRTRNQVLAKLRAAAVSVNNNPASERGDNPHAPPSS